MQEHSSQILDNPQTHKPKHWSWYLHLSLLILSILYYVLLIIRMKVAYSNLDSPLLPDYVVPYMFQFELNFAIVSFFGFVPSFVSFLIRKNMFGWIIILLFVILGIRIMKIADLWQWFS